MSKIDSLYMHFAQTQKSNWFMRTSLSDIVKRIGEKKFWIRLYGGGDQREKTKNAKYHSRVAHALHLDQQFQVVVTPCLCLQPKGNACTPLGPINVSLVGYVFLDTSASRIVNATSTSHTICCTGFYCGSRV